MSLIAISHLHEDESVLPGEGLALLPLDVAPRLQITLVADEHDDHVGVGVLPRVLQPGRQVVECVPGEEEEAVYYAGERGNESPLPSGDVVYEQRARRAAVVTAGYGPKRLLPGLYAKTKVRRKLYGKP